MRLGWEAIPQAQVVGSSWERLVQLASRQHGVISRQDARRCGVEAQPLRRAVAAGRLTRVLSDVFTVAGAPSTWRQRLRVATAAGAIISHRSAAALHRLDGFQPGIVEVTFERHRHREIPAATVHRWSRNDEMDITIVEDIRTTSVARTLVQLGAVVEAAKVEQALDDALRRGVNRAWIAETLERLQRRGPTGVAVLEQLLNDPLRSGERPDSHFERLLQRMLAVPGLPRPVLQYEVRLRSGRTRRLDLAFPDVKLAVEAHSHRWHATASDWHADQQRHLELATVGWTVLFITWPMLQRSDETVEAVATRYWQLKTSRLTS